MTSIVLSENVSANPSSTKSGMVNSGTFSLIIRELSGRVKFTVFTFFAPLRSLFLKVPTVVNLKLDSVNFIFSSGLLVKSKF